MCRFRSYVVTRTEVLSRSFSDSHEDIISYFDLDDSGINPKFVRVELIPPRPCELSKDDSGRILVDDSWRFELDEKIVPKWVDLVDVERRVRDNMQQELDNNKFYRYKVQGLYPFNEHLPSDCSAYLLNTDYVGPVPTVKDIPDTSIRRRLASIRVVPLAQPPTVQDEPVAGIRDVLARHAVNLYPFTVEEEPAEYIRQRYVEEWNGKFPKHRQRMLTAAEEPAGYLRINMWARYKAPINLPDDYQHVPICKGHSEFGDLIRLMTGGYNAASNQIETQVAHILALVYAGYHRRLSNYSAVAIDKALQVLEEHNPQLCGK